MISSRRWLFPLLLCVPHLLFGQAAAASSAPPEVSFTFERAIPGVAVPRYTVVVRGDGSGTYHAEVAAANNQSQPQALDRTMTFAPATLKAAFDGVRLMRSSHSPCETRLKNIADTGKKTLTYRDEEGDGSCSYNYSENKGVVQLTELFQAIEMTLEAGRALDFKHRFDRLGLDAEMITLENNVDAGRAVALETILPTLRSIAGDTELIERVRLRAAKLLERAGIGINGASQAASK